MTPNDTLKKPSLSIPWIITALIFFIAAQAHASREAKAPSETASIIRSERPAVEVVFVLDTTGSMSGLIAAAKEKIWSIANTLASADPAPEIRMGVIGYRDRGDAYVTTSASLSEDLDGVYSSLMQFQAAGGGDTPESVNQALHEAVTKTDWSAAPSTYRVIFLVGDAPPHMDYQDDVPYRKTCKIAAGKGIVINTIQCGNMGSTEPFFREMANLGLGDYFRVVQSGSAVLYDTPYDREIADLSRKLDDTRIYYGTAEERHKEEKRKAKADSIYSAAAPSAVAKRTIFNSKEAGKKNFLGSQELVYGVEEGDVELDKIEKESLPEDLRKLSPKELEEVVKAKGEQRKEIQEQIDHLAKKRQAYIEEKVRNEKDGGDKSLDMKIYKSIRTQAAEKNILYKKGPSY